MRRSDRRKAYPPLLILAAALLFACAPLAPGAYPTQGPGAVDTLIALKATEAAMLTQTAIGPATFTSTPGRITLTPSQTMPATATMLFLLKTNTPTPSQTPTRVVIPTVWPDWTTGDVVDMPQGSGEGIGVTKYFSSLAHVTVVVVRTNGVKLRKLPTKALGGPIAPKGTILILTGYWNKNNDFGAPWSFMKVITEDGRQYWVGGDANDDTSPTASFAFYTPPEPTATFTSTPTP